MSKRGLIRGKTALEHSLWTLVEIALIALVVIAMFSFIRDIKENRFFERSVLSKDTALLIDTAQSVPGDVFYTYSHSGIDIDKYMFRFDKYDIEVKDSDSQQKNTYPYYNDDNLVDSYQNPINQPQKIQFMKPQSGLAIGTEVQQEFGKRKCTSADTSSDKIDFIYLVYSEKKLEGLANALKQQLELRKITTSLFLQSDIEKLAVNNKIALPSNIDLFLSVSLGEDDNTARLPVIAHFSNAESSKLACFITNEFLDKAIWMTDSVLAQESGSILLPEDRRAVQLELGNKKSPVFDIKDTKTKDTIAAWISEGIQKYEGSKK